MNIKTLEEANDILRQLKGLAKIVEEGRYSAYGHYRLQATKAENSIIEILSKLDLDDFTR